MVQKLLYGINSIIILSICLFFTGCDFSCGEEEQVPLEKQLQDFDKLQSFAKDKIHPDIGFAMFDYFSPDSVKRIAVCREITNFNEWGIKFGYYKLKGDSVEQIFETDLLEGATDESSISSLELNGYRNKLLYYNSNSYFLGSGGGEVFVYIIDFSTKEVNYGHLIISPRYPVSLYISANTKSDISEFITGNFKKEYPGLRLIKKDIKLEE